MSVINTNIKALAAQDSSRMAENKLSTATQRLSTGLRINSAKDDAAGLAISTRMTAQVRGFGMAIRNANDGISMLQTVEGSLTEVTNMLQRMRELAVQSVNGTNSDTDRAALNTEYSQLSTEITRISDKTTWNGMEVVGSAAAAMSFQIGDASGATVTFTFKDINANSFGSVSSAQGQTISAAAGATSAIGLLDQAIVDVDTYRSQLGAMVNRLTYTADNLTNIATNTSASRSRILDADYAQATTELARTQIIQQAATAMLAQANQSNSGVLSLLR